MIIRSFEFERDWQGVHQLWSQAGAGIQLSRSDAPEEIRKKLLRDPDLFLVAEQDGAIVGAVLGGFDGRRGLMYHLAIAHSHRRQGLGTQLMQALEQRLAAKGCLKYYLLVTRKNTDALAFYLENGCEIMDLKVLGKEIA